MRNLIYSGFMRLKASPYFYLALVATFLYSLFFSVLSPYYVTVDDVPVTIIGGATFMLLPVYLFASAAFVCLFLGEDQQERMLNAPVIAGYTHVQIYLSRLIICCIGNLSILLPAIFASIAVGCIQGGIWAQRVPILLFYLVSCMAMSTALTALQVMSASLIPRPSLSIVITLLLSLGLFVVSLQVHNLLASPAAYPDYSRLTPDMNPDEIGQLPMILNPQYVKAPLRNWLEFFQCISPIGQLTEHMYVIRYPDVIPLHIDWLITSILVTLAAAFSGAAAFRRANLR